MPGSWTDDHGWRAIVAELPLNTESGIYRYWRQLRSEGTFLGWPVTPELDTPVGKQQLFSSGACINWSDSDGASLAHDA